jgi:predicted O-methyltransferase YrrM
VSGADFGERAALSEELEGKYLRLDDDLYAYVVALGAREDEALARVRRETAALGGIAVMQVSPDQGALLTMLARLLGARRALELGTFTGYSAICIARGLDEDGILLACELDPDRAEAARANFAIAGVEDRVEIRVGPALDTLEALAADDAEPFDLVFVDADKEGYDAYYERSLELIRPGGLIVIDNTLRGGDVLAAEPENAGTRVVQALNERIAADERVDVSMLALADGITLARKR